MDPATIIALITAASKLIEQGVKFMEDRKMNHEMTPDEQAQWDEFVNQQMSKPYWKKSTE